MIAINRANGPCINRGTSSGSQMACRLKSNWLTTRYSAVRPTLTVTAGNTGNRRIQQPSIRPQPANRRYWAGRGNGLTGWSFNRLANAVAAISTPLRCKPLFCE